MAWSALVWALNMLLNWQLAWAMINVVNFFRNILSKNSISFTKRKKWWLSIVYITIYLAFAYVLSDQYWYLPVIASTIWVISLFLLD